MELNDTRELLTDWIKSNTGLLVLPFPCNEYGIWLGDKDYGHGPSINWYLDRAGLPTQEEYDNYHQYSIIWVLAARESYHTDGRIDESVGPCILLRRCVTYHQGYSFQRDTVIGFDDPDFFSKLGKCLEHDPNECRAPAGSRYSS